jgi:hypothetical protein
MIRDRWIVGGLVAISLAGQCSGQEDRMTLELRQVVSATESDGGTVLTVVLDGGEEVRLTREDYAPAALDDHEAWLRGIAKKNGFAGYDPTAGALFPATVALEVIWGQDVDLEGGAVQVFAFPRPAAILLRRDLEAFARLEQVVDQAVTGGHGAVFALRSGVWIEDVKVILQEDAERLLNMAPMQ